MLHVSSDRSVQECRNVLRLNSARANSSLDCEEKEIWLTYKDESIRARKKLVRGGGNYSCRSSLLMFSSSSLIPNCVPERRYEGIGAHNTTDALGLIQALPTSALWHEPRTARNPIKHETLSNKQSIIQRAVPCLRRSFSDLPGDSLTHTPSNLFVGFK
jgi:hypothetical protein